MAGEPITLRGMGSFHVGGRTVEIKGEPVRELVLSPGGMPLRFDPNGLHQVEAMYVQYFLPDRCKGQYPLLLWHGGGLTGVTYESTPDGREGWLNMFLRKGWDVYVSDAVERGRSGFAPPSVWPDEPIFLPKQNPFERFRIGQGAGSWNADPGQMKVLPGNQFPVEAYDTFMKQVVPRWMSTDGPLSPLIRRCSTSSARASCFATARAAALASGWRKRAPNCSRRWSRLSRPWPATPNEPASSRTYRR